MRNCNRQEEGVRVMDMCIILILVMASWVYPHAER